MPVDLTTRRAMSVTWQRTSFSNSFQLRRSENLKNAANPAFFELYCKLPKLRTWVRFPSPAPYTSTARTELTQHSNLRQLLLKAIQDLVQTLNVPEFFDDLVALWNVRTMFGHLYPSTAPPGLLTYWAPAPFFARFGSGSVLSKS